MPMPQRDTSTRKITNLLNIVKTSIKNIKDGFVPGLPQPKPQAIPTISPQTAPSGTSGGDLDLFGIKCIYKSKPDGRVVTNPDIRFFTRRYRSGKANDPTVECTFRSKDPNYKPGMYCHNQDEWYDSSRYYRLENERWTSLF